MADAAITFLLENGVQLVKSYYDLISGAENELKQLRDEVALLKAYLRQASRKEQKDDPLREMERQIREAIYDAEDTIDSCLTDAGVANTRFKLLRSLRPKRGSLASEVKSLRKDTVTPLLSKAEKFFSNMQTGEGSGKSLDGSNKSVQEPLRNLRQKVPSIRQDKIVGFEDEEKTVLGYLMEKRPKLDVISIIGMPGLGKTTLAWKVFQNEDVKFEFPIRIWVNVSQELNMKDVLVTILKGFRKNDDLSRLDYDDLHESVCESLKTTRFLLVLDDVWTVDALEALKKVLPDDNMMAKVLITTRQENVGTHANVKRKPHKLAFLKEKESWELLRLKVFEDDACPGYLESTGKQIAKKCGGLPLALVVIGGILVDQFSKAQGSTAILSAWEDVEENVSKYFKDYVKDEDKEKGTADVVALSYNKLPDALRDCFLYLGVFREDYEIPAWTLTRLWIAEGFIQQEGTESLEKTAEENLNDLISRNLVMVEKRNHINEVKTCKVHDVIRQFCISKADEQNLFKEIKKSKEGVLHPPVADIDKYRRLCMHSNLSDFLSSARRLKGPGIRSFLCFYNEPFTMEAKYISTIPDAFPLLRVLDYMSVKFNQFPSKITKLIHLRYVTLSWDDLDFLPAAISELWNLQTLVIDTKSRTIEIEANIWKLIQLRHIKTKAAIKLLETRGEGRKAGENLQTLSRLSPESCKDEVFTKARNLKRLGISGRLHNLLEANCSLENLAFLDNLKLVNDLSYELESGKSLRSLLQPKFLPRKLKRLTLSATYLDWSDMSTLGEIDTLQVLKLKNKAFVGRRWKVQDGSFDKLQFLLIANTDLVYWVASAGHFPSLRCLVLRNCETLSEIPLCLAESLEKLDIAHVPDSAFDSAKNIQKKKELMPLGQENARWGTFELKLPAGRK
ncbi:UNVERIFIED_CONTAM: putative disease resistance protein [Sesamum radiatum]|uniref:Disease resistance protein n=1 Tax=Sesamum radiatum TaxID=300843 RepID=A0AAW2PN17_SESRA